MNKFLLAFLLSLIFTQVVLSKNMHIGKQMKVLHPEEKGEIEKTEKVEEPVEQTEEPIEQTEETEEQTEEPVEQTEETEKVEEPVEQTEETEQTEEPVEQTEETEQTEEPTEETEETEQTEEPEEETDETEQVKEPEVKEPEQHKEIFEQHKEIFEQHKEPEQHDDFLKQSQKPIQSEKRQVQVVRPHKKSVVAVAIAFRKAKRVATANFQAKKQGEKSHHHEKNGKLNATKGKANAAQRVRHVDGQVNFDLKGHWDGQFNDIKKRQQLKTRFLRKNGESLDKKNKAFNQSKSAEAKVFAAAKALKVDARRPVVRRPVHNDKQDKF